MKLDRADETARAIMAQITPHVGMHPKVRQLAQAAIAEGIRDAQRETAEECCKIANELGVHMQRAPRLVRTIRERFGLKEGS